VTWERWYGDSGGPHTSQWGVGGYNLTLQSNRISKRFVHTLNASCATRQHPPTPRAHHPAAHDTTTHTHTRDPMPLRTTAYRMKEQHDQEHA